MNQSSSRQRAAPQIEPAIAEILRTCIYPEILPLRVERVIRTILNDETDSENEVRGGHVTKLLLTDGDLVLQALLHRRLSTLPEIVNLCTGDVVEIRKFVVKKGRRRNGQGHVVYLGIEDCYVIKTAESTHEGDLVRTSTRSEITGRKRKVKTVKQEGTAGDSTVLSGVFSLEHAQPDLSTKRRKLENHSHSRDSIHETGCSEDGRQMEVLTRQTTESEERPVIEASDMRRPQAIRSTTPNKRIPTISPDSDDETAFETMTVNLNTATKRRQALHDLSQNIVSSPTRPPTRDSLGLTKKPSVIEHKNETRQSVVRFAMAEEDYKHNNQMLLSPPASKTDQDLPSTTYSKPQFQNPLVKHQELQSTANLNVIAPQPPAILHTPASVLHQMPPSQQQPYPFHPLSELSSPNLPSKSYIFSTLIIPTYVSSHLISRPHSTFPPKRHIRVIDPSFLPAAVTPTTAKSLLGKGITVSVYRSAANFKPIIGRVALMRGVVMQRIRSAQKQNQSSTSGTANTSATGEVILNVYPEKSRIQRATLGHVQTVSQPTTTASEQGGSEAQVEDSTGQVSVREQQQEDVQGCWFIDDHALLREWGYEVEAMQKWWDGIMGLK